MRRAFRKLGDLVVDSAAFAMVAVIAYRIFADPDFSPFPHRRQRL